MLHQWTSLIGRVNIPISWVHPVVNYKHFKALIIILPYSLQYSALSLSLPQNVHLLTMEPWRSYSLLVRFEHILEKNEDPEYSKPVKFNLEDIFRSFDITDVRETTLSGNQWIEEASRLKFRADPSSRASNATAATDDMQRRINMVKYTKYPFKSFNAPNYKADFEITLSPMQIRTFVIQLNDQPRVRAPTQSIPSNLNV